MIRKIPGYSSAQAKKGVVLILVFIVMVTLSVITITFLFMTSKQLRSTAYDVESSEAFWLAEAGLQRYVYLIHTRTYTTDSHPNLSADLGAGSYLVAASYDSDTSEYTLTSTGTVGVMNRKITQNFAVVPAGTFPYAIHADGSVLNFNGSNPATCTVNGSVSCSVQVSNEDDVDITGTITEDVSLSPALDLPTYAALADHTEGRFTFESGNTYAGVYYCTGRVGIESNVVINGSVICESTITFDNSATNITINPSNNYPAIYAANSISSSGTGSNPGLQNSTINGLVMAGNNITFNKMQSTTFTGVIIAGNNISLESGTSFTITYDSVIFSSPAPAGFSFTSDAVITPQTDWDEVVPDA